MKPILLNMWSDTAKDMLQGALDYWNERYNSIFDILTTSPSDFQGGGIWDTVTTVESIIKGTGVSLVVLFFLYGLFKSSIGFQDFRRNPKQIIFSLFRIGIANFFVLNATDLLTDIMTVVQNIIVSINAGALTSDFQLPQDLIDALDKADWGAGFGAFAAALIGTVGIHLLSIIILVVVYGRFFKIFLLSAVSPIPLAGFAGESTESLCTNFLKTYIGECMRGIVILVACMIFSAFAVSPVTTTSTTPGGMTWAYIGDVLMQMLLLVIIVKSSDRLVKEIFGF